MWFNWWFDGCIEAFSFLCCEVNWSYSLFIHGVLRGLLLPEHLKSGNVALLRLSSGQTEMYTEVDAQHNHLPVSMAKGVVLLE